MCGKWKEGALFLPCTPTHLLSISACHPLGGDTQGREPTTRVLSRNHVVTPQCINSSAAQRVNNRTNIREGASRTTLQRNSPYRPQDKKQTQLKGTQLVHVRTSSVSRQELSARTQKDRAAKGVRRWCLRCDSQNPSTRCRIHSSPSSSSKIYQTTTAPLPYLLPQQKQEEDPSHISPATKPN